MATGQQLWQFLRPKASARLEFLSHVSPRTKVRVVDAPCRLPGCSEVVDRSTAAGRPGWFHSRRCADAFRIQCRALDAAIDELVDQHESPNYTSRERARIRSDLQWLIEVRTTYVTPGAWRYGELPEEDSSSDEPVARYVAAARTARAKPEPTDRCPTCQGTGDLSTLRERPRTSGELKRRESADLLAEMAMVFRRFAHLQPSIQAVEAAAYWDEQAERHWRELALDGERRLQQLLRRKQDSSKGGP